LYCCELKIFVRCQNKEMAPSDGNYIDSYGHLLVNSGFIFTYLVHMNLVRLLSIFWSQLLLRNIFGFFCLRLLLLKNLSILAPCFIYLESQTKSYRRRGTAFISREFTDFLHSKNIFHRFIATAAPSWKS